MLVLRLLEALGRGTVIFQLSRFYRSKPIFGMDMGFHIGGISWSMLRSLCRIPASTHP